MTRKPAKMEIIQQPPSPPESPSFTLERIYELEKHARERLEFWLAKKQEVKVAREMYDGAVDLLMQTIRKAHEPEFEFTVTTSKNEEED